MASHILKINGDDWNTLGALKKGTKWGNMNDYIVNEIINPFLQGFRNASSQSASVQFMALEVRVNNIEETLLQIVKGQYKTETLHALDVFPHLELDDDQIEEPDIDLLDLNYLQTLSFTELEPIATTLGVRGKSTITLLKGLRALKENSEVEALLKEKENSVDPSQDS